MATQPCSKITISCPKIRFSCNDPVFAHENTLLFPEHLSFTGTKASKSWQQSLPVSFYFHPTKDLNNGMALPEGGRSLDSFAQMRLILQRMRYRASRADWKACGVAVGAIKWNQQRDQVLKDHRVEPQRSRLSFWNGQDQTITISRIALTNKVECRLSSHLGGSPGATAASPITNGPRPLFARHRQN